MENNMPTQQDFRNVRESIQDDLIALLSDRLDVKTMDAVCQIVCDRTRVLLENGE